MNEDHKHPAWALIKRNPQPPIPQEIGAGNSELVCLRTWMPEFDFSPLTAANSCKAGNHFSYRRSDLMRSISPWWLQSVLHRHTKLFKKKNKFSKILDARRRQKKAHLCCRGQSKGRTFWFFHQPRRLAFPKKLKRRRKKFKKHLFMHFYSTTSRLFILYFLTFLLYIGLCYISPLANILRFLKVFRRY